MRKGIYGGTFDPIHNGHIALAKTALEKLNLTKVIFVPCGNPPHKEGRNVTDAALRLQLIKLAICNNSKFEVSDFEVKEKGYSYTYKTLEHFKAQEEDTEWFFLSGMDCLFDFEKWKYPERIISAAKFVSISREGYVEDEILSRKNYLERKYGYPIEILPMDLSPISSSNIRNLVKSGKNYSDFLPKEVYNEIVKLSLYKEWRGYYVDFW